MRVLSNVGKSLKCTKSSTLVVSIQEILDGIFYFHHLYLCNYAFTVSVVKSIQIGGTPFGAVLAILSQAYRKK